MTDDIRRYLLRLRYAIPQHAHEAMSIYVARALNDGVSAVPGDIPNMIGLNELMRDGIARLEPALTDSQIIEAHNALAPFRVYDGWKRTPGDWPADGVPAPVHVAHYPPNAMTVLRPLLRYANHRELIASIARYFGCLPTIGYFSLWWSLAGRGDPQDAELFHVDKHDYKWLKLFVYLTDVGMDAGPHVVVRGTHRPEVREEAAKIAAHRGQTNRFHAMLSAQRKSDADVEEFYGTAPIEYVTGLAGDAFIVNTAALHKGLAPDKRNRLAFQALYVMMPDAKIAPTMIDMPGLFERCVMNDARLSMDQLRYINRLVVRS